MSKTKDEATAYRLGANIGDELIGIENRNKGLIIEVLKIQEPKAGGPVKGEFKVKNIGIWKGANKLKDVEGNSFTAGSFIEEVKTRLGDPKIKWLVNINGFKIHK